MATIVRIGLSRSQLDVAYNSLVFHDRVPIIDVVVGDEKKQITEVFGDDVQVMVINTTLTEERTRENSSTH